jgi:hypothetical protein
MGYNVKIKGNSGTIELNRKIVASCQFMMDSPDDSNAKATDVGMKLKITGRILTVLDGGTDESIKLSQWALLGSESADSYKDVVVTNNTTGMVVREFHFPNAFVLSYNETFGDETGVGEFTLVLRQKKDMNKKIMVNGYFGE